MSARSHIGSRVKDQVHTGRVGRIVAEDVAPLRTRFAVEFRNGDIVWHSAADLVWQDGGPSRAVASPEDSTR